MLELKFLQTLYWISSQQQKSPINTTDLFTSLINADLIPLIIVPILAIFSKSYQDFKKS